MSRSGMDVPAALVWIAGTIFIIGLIGVRITGIEIPFISDLDIVIEATRNVENFSGSLVGIGIVIALISTGLWIWDRKY